MMRFKHFLTEAYNNRTLPGDEETILKHLIKNVNKDMLKKFVSANSDYDQYEWSSNKTGILGYGDIWRGMNDRGKVAIVSNPVNRVSANTSNEFTLMVNNLLPSWSNYPKRSESFICSTDPDRAGDFGNCYLILPFGNPNIGVCSSDDMWDSFDYGIKKLGQEHPGEFIPQMNYVIGKLLPNLLLPKDKWISTGNGISIDKLKTAFNEIGKLITNKAPIVDTTLKAMETKDVSLLDKLGLPSYAKSYFHMGEILILMIQKSGGNVIKVFDDIFHTKKNGFELITASNLIKWERHNREVWLSGTVAIVNQDNLAEIATKIRNIITGKSDDESLS